MIRVIFILLLIMAFAAGAAMLLRMRPERLATVLRYLAAAIAGAIGAILLIGGRVQFAMPILAGSFFLFRHAVTRSRSTRKPGRKSRVYSDLLMMELDLDSGEMNGMVLKGAQKGASLNELDEAALFALYRESEPGSESRELLETYLDRRIADWRDRADTHGGAGLGAAPGAGAMTQKEAYEILGLVPGAGEAEIRQAHRRLMKRVHPDTGGSAALAARLNAAKDLLLHGHV